MDPVKAQSPRGGRIIFEGDIQLIAQNNWVSEILFGLRMAPSRMVRP